MFKWFAVITLAAWATTEVWLLLVLGEKLGLMMTLLWMVASALIGMIIMRVGAFSVLGDIHYRLRREQLPTQELLDMGLLLSGGLMLIMPGFFTDFLGLFLIIPPFRWVFRRGLALGIGLAFRSAFGPEQHTSMHGSSTPFTDYQYSGNDDTENDYNEDNIIEIKKEE